MRTLSFTRRILTLTVKETPLEKALEMAELNLTLYDDSYLALAAETETPLITADDELHEKGMKTINVIPRIRDEAVKYELRTEGKRVK